MPWIVYVADAGQEPEEIARAATQERAKAFAEIARTLARRDNIARDVTVQWADEPEPSVWRPGIQLTGQRPRALD